VFLVLGKFVRGSKPKPVSIKVVERKLGREGALGQCFQGERYVEIDPRQEAQERLDTLIHETLHVLLPFRSEPFIEKAAATLTRVLWKQRYRRIEK
jgi:hypothetical protein